MGRARLREGLEVYFAERCRKDGAAPFMDSGHIHRRLVVRAVVIRAGAADLAKKNGGPP